VTIEQVSMTTAGPQKITFGELRTMGLTRILVDCVNCARYKAVSADRWPDDARLSDLERHFVCTVCGHRGADVRPDFSGSSKPLHM